MVCTTSESRRRSTLRDCWESNSVNWRTQNDFEGAVAIGWEAGIRTPITWSRGRFTRCGLLRSVLFPAVFHDGISIRSGPFRSVPVQVVSLCLSRLSSALWVRPPSSRLRAANELQLAARRGLTSRSGCLRCWRRTPPAAHQRAHELPSSRCNEPVRSVSG